MPTRNSVPDFNLQCTSSPLFPKKDQSQSFRDVREEPDQIEYVRDEISTESLKEKKLQTMYFSLKKFHSSQRSIYRQAKELNYCAFKTYYDKKYYNKGSNYKV